MHMSIGSVDAVSGQTDHWGVGRRSVAGPLELVGRAVLIGKWGGQEARQCQDRELSINSLREKGPQEQTEVEVKPS